MTQIRRLPAADGRAIQVWPWIILALIVSLGAYLRLPYLGTRSLWLDEFATWHVSRMGLGQSLVWSPEIVPPLYQFCLRLLTSAPHPEEWMLRLPAGLCGVGVILAIGWLVPVRDGWAVSIAAAGLIAFNATQIQYSQEARPYSMLVLGGVVSTALWLRLVLTPRRRLAIAYVVVATLTLYAHQLAALVLLAHAVWALLVWIESKEHHRFTICGISLGITAVLSAPLAVRFVLMESSIARGLNWIAPLSAGSGLATLGEITVGPVWVLGLLVPSIVLWIVGRKWFQRLPCGRPSDGVFQGASDPCTLLVVWFLCTAGALVLASLAGQPSFVPRYAIVAAVPALLIPLVIAHRLNRHLPLIIMTLAVVASAAQWVSVAKMFEPGFRELTMFLNTHAAPQSDRVVLAIDNATHDEWAEMERLGFLYYPLEALSYAELLLDSDGRPLNPEVLDEPGTIYLIVLQSDVMQVARMAGRRIEPITTMGNSYEQLLFAPWRVARLSPPDG